MRLPDLRKIDIRNPKIQGMLGIVIATVVVGILSYEYLIKENDAKKRQLESTYEQKKNELNKINSMRPRLARLRKDNEKLQLQLDSLRSIFPDKKEVPKLIHEITKVASQAGIFTNKFNPLPDVVREHYIENNYYMSVVGGYHELADFFSYLAEFELKINLTNVSIRMNPGVASSIKEYEEHGGTVRTVVSTFTMTTFSSKK